jgi:hypothetical protein
MSDITERISLVPDAARPMVRAARRVVREIAPDADEIAYHGGPPRSSRSMWKLIQYRVVGEPVLSIGTYPTYATVFFYRGRELDDGSGRLEGSGKDLRFLRLRTPGDAGRPAVRKIIRKAFRLARAGPAASPAKRS